MLDRAGVIRPPRTGTLAVGAVLALATMCLLSLMIGSNPISPARVWDGLWDSQQEAADIVRGGRIPRTVLGVLIGAALGITGAVLQSLTRNPIADPGLLGVNAGASAAVVTGISAFGITQPTGYVWFALAGAGVASVLVYLLGGAGRQGSTTPVKLALAGTAISATLLSYVSAVILLDPWAYTSFRFWDIGSLTGRSLGELGFVVWLLVAGLAAALVLGRPLNALALGDDTSRALGARPGPIRLLGILVCTVLCGSATAAVGPIAFVGLAVPHVARALFGADHRRSLPAAAVLGALVLLCADVVGRVIAWPQETGVGIVTAVVGAPFLIVLVRRRRIGRL